MNLIIGFYYGWKLSLAIIAMAPLIVITSFVMTKVCELSFKNILF